MAPPRVEHCVGTHGRAASSVVICHIIQWIEEALAFFLRVEYAPVRRQFTQDAGIVVSGFVPVLLPNSRVVALNVEQLGAAANDTPVGAAFPLPRNASSSIVHCR
ncbi:MAG: hypothetical protein IJH49_01870 [Aeriscardovia sp.]|nr:hypothetical protein [Aeriscardovia sp.]